MRGDRKITIAVTGGIGSGKSLVCSMLERRGVPVYDSDSETKALYETVPGLLDRISSALGTDVTDGNGRLDRAKLASEVFSCPEKLNILENMVYPEVKKNFESWRLKKFSDGAPVVAMESALVLEKPFFRDLFDKILLVDAPVEQRLQRAMHRDGADRDAILKRMSMQRLLNDISEGKVSPGADFIIVNDGNIGDLEKKTEEVYIQLNS